MTATRQAVLRTKDLTTGYPLQGKTPAKIVSSAVDLELRAGELVCLLGPNGAGKSTFLRTMAAMQRPLSGEVLFHGRNIHAIPARELARSLSVVLTERVQAALLSVYDLVSLGRYPYTDWAGRLGGEDHAVVARCIRSVGAEHLAHRQICELSDGERQKVMVARALAQEPRLMILDEITAFLDLPRRVEIMRLLRRLAHEEGCAILLSTHDLDLALRSADRIWLMPAGSTRAADAAAAQIYAGAPEDLVLTGAFEAVFSGEGITFDRDAGHFRLHEATAGYARVIGQGTPALWTARALERLGYDTNAHSHTSLSVEVTSESCKTVWVLRREDVISRHYSLEDTARAVRFGADGLGSL
jgi:iron complex transport system ATP-binding protein